MVSEEFLTNKIYTMKKHHVYAVDNSGKWQWRIYTSGCASETCSEFEFDSEEEALKEGRNYLNELSE